MKAFLLKLRKTWWGRLATDVLVIGAVVTVMGQWQTRSHLRDAPAPQLVLPLLDGPPVALSSYRGRPVLLEFWAPWCTVCKAESQNISWVKALVGDHARVISVVSGYDSVAQVRAYMDSRGVDYPVLLGNDNVTRAFRVEAFPTVYFLDGEGNVKRSAVGYTTSLGLLARLLL